MAQNNEPRNFEEYNFQEFLKLKRENETLKKENKELSDERDTLVAYSKDLLEIVKGIANSITIKIDSNGNFKSVYATVDNDDRYIGSYWIDDLEKSEYKFYKALEYAKRVVEDECSKKEE